MEFQGSKMIEAHRSSPNGGAKIWLESISPGMRTVEAVLRELSQNDVPVLVVAEHGSGKAAAAARIHNLSGAPRNRSGLPGPGSRRAVLAGCDGQGGTVYLQEVGDLTAAAQKELVRQIDSNDAERDRVPRYICGTTCELEPEVRAGKVREDLYYRISGVCLRCRLCVSGARIFRFCVTGFFPRRRTILGARCHA